MNPSAGTDSDNRYHNLIRIVYYSVCRGFHVFYKNQLQTVPFDTISLRYLLLHFITCSLTLPRSQYNQESSSFVNISTRGCYHLQALMGWHPFLLVELGIADFWIH